MSLFDEAEAARIPDLPLPTLRILARNCPECFDCLELLSMPKIVHNDQEWPRGLAGPGQAPHALGRPGHGQARPDLA